MKKTTEKKSDLDLEVIEDRTWRSGRDQDVYRTRVERVAYPSEFPDVKARATLRFHLRANTYDFQSRANVEVWTPTGWVEVHHLSGTQVAQRFSVLRDTLTGAFDADIARLRGVALKVLGGEL